MKRLHGNDDVLNLDERPASMVFEQLDRGRVAEGMRRRMEHAEHGSFDLGTRFKIGRASWWERV